MKTGRVALLVAVVLSGACATSTTERLGLPPLQTVARVDLSRYVGTWYEIASFPQHFQKGCTATTATYTLQDDGEIGVLNRCRKGSPNGKLASAKGRARVTDTTSNAKLEVTFFWPFWGDYWIIDLGGNAAAALDAPYEYAVVGHPGRDYLWILSRKPVMSAALYAKILQRLRNKGYQVERLNKTLQPRTAAPISGGAG